MNRQIKKQTESGPIIKGKTNEINDKSGIQKAAEYSLLVIISVNLMYAVTSSGLTFINKALYTNFGFQSPLDLLLIQCLCNVAICTPMMIYKEYNPKSFKILDKFGMHVTPLSQAVQKWKLGVVIGLGNLITVAFGIYSVKYVSIPLFLTFRRCTILTTFLANYLLTRKGLDSRTYLKLSLITIGAIIAGLDTFNRDWFGYALIWMNNLSQSVTNIFNNKINNQKIVTTFEMNFFYAWVGLPLLTYYAVYTGEIKQLFDVLQIEDLTYRFNFLSLLILSGTLGITITLSTLLVVNLCSPFMLNINGNFKNILSAALGFVMFNDQKPTFLVVSGILVGFMGSCLYAYDELMQLRLKRKTKYDFKKE
ncbi:udp-sugar transporter sqv-7-like [Stylonychia lemnae]|uniref:Udp-sugar transporter sqv-7-like n=1 Tax=Stylonychia lemnae TaxID=5949 RepID=A0A077ZU16_STYLE|nr:udp-sugar transporter sqv-7-like [Stylonychia lemnae]|eukprot:CDW73393.1 udp-sugar transporter sqv-7-like [Stylonychia lemnae]